MCSQNCVVALFHTKSCLTLCDPMDCSLPGSCVHVISQVRIPEWVVIPSSGDHPDPGMEPASPASPALVSRFFTTEPLGKHQSYQRLYFHRFKPRSLWSFAMAALGFMAHFYHHREIWTALWSGEMDSVTLLECVSLYGEDGKTLTQTNLVSMTVTLYSALKGFAGVKDSTWVIPCLPVHKAPSCLPENQAGRG